jgi:hypothetical protein
MGVIKRTFRTGVSLIAGATTLFAVLAVVSAAPASASTVGCPSPTGKQTSNLVGAHFTDSSGTVTYYFDSFVDEHPTGGVPGLIKYCVYPDTAPDGAITTTAIGDNLAPWGDAPPSPQFSFDRPDGNASNLGLDGRTNYEMGTAIWSADNPGDQTILLHINDSDECTALYGPGGDPSAPSGTCFVLPGQGGGGQGEFDLSVTKTATASFARAYSWDISKDVDKTKVNIADGGTATFNYTVNVTKTTIDSGWQVNGTITVSNPNNHDVSGVDVTDAIDNGGSCSVSGGTGLTVPASGSVDVAYACTYASAPSPSAGTNTATATWPDFGSPDTTATGSASVDFSTVDPTTSGFNCVNVTDTFGGSLGQACVSHTFAYSHDFSGVGGTCTQYDNTATITETAQSASKSVTVCVGKDLTVGKDATPSFTRTYNWSIAKSVDKTIVKQIGGSTTFNYTVQVNETGFTDSAWAVKGTIDVTNPNDWESITFNLADAVNNGGSCSITGGGSNLTVAANSVGHFNYTCTYGSAPSPAAGTNTATATWDSSAFSTPTGSAQGTASFAFGDPTTRVNQTTIVSDTYAGILGTLTASDDLGNLTTHTYTYARTISIPQFDCLSYPNTASLSTGGSSSVTVTVCGPAKTGALTMGYWQNKNGQAIIKGGASTGGVCNSGTWLRQYAPFQDLSSTANCTAVASYVTNVIKAANASGASMNAMLKAQMLATALDVYFSDSALGGNKIGAPAPIGGVDIDLTLICKMIDNSSGSGTCSGTFENVSSAFGGATHLTVSAMLAYAASQSNVGGTVWYGQVKATQALAKDAFDAINNQVAFKFI